MPTTRFIMDGDGTHLTMGILHTMDTTGTIPGTHLGITTTTHGITHTDMAMDTLLTTTVRASTLLPKLHIMAPEMVQQTIFRALLAHDLPETI